MPTVLITGGTGLIGKALTEKLLEKGYEIIVLSRKTS
ncbi:MAG TPA: NAD-dependent epimerase/dehydratase family protein, partial [Puia sp.]|nr:NAD-dependent epimerase/dehydratase family protein [Puia sp.]